MDISGHGKTGFEHPMFNKKQLEKNTRAQGSTQRFQASCFDSGPDFCEHEQIEVPEKLLWIEIPDPQNRLRGCSNLVSYFWDPATEQGRDPQKSQGRTELSLAIWGSAPIRHDPDGSCLSRIGSRSKLAPAGSLNACCAPGETGETHDNLVSSSLATSYMGKNTTRYVINPSQLQVVAKVIFPKCRQRGKRVASFPALEELVRVLHMAQSQLEFGPDLFPGCTFPL